MIVHSGAKAAGVDASPTGSTNTHQALSGVPDAYVFETWFYVDAWGAGNLFATILMANWDPGTGSADHVTRLTMESTLVRWTVWRPVAGPGVLQDVPISLALDSWHSFDVLVDTTAGTQCLFVDGVYRATASVPPSQTWKPDVVLFGDSSYLGDAGIAYYDDLSLDTATRPPQTTLIVGSPSYLGPTTYVTTATLLSLSAQDFSGTGILRTDYRINGGTWFDYGLTGPFALPSEGEHLVEYRSEDNAGNVETIRQAAIRVDDTPPSTSMDIAGPSYVGAETFITSATLLTLVASDGGVLPVGVEAIEYSWDAQTWIPYTAPFSVQGPDGLRALYVRSRDRLGNSEAVQLLPIHLDNTPPTATLAIPSDPLALDSAFTLSAVDLGCGVARIEYRVDGGAWTPYEAPFTLGVGDHVIQYRAADRLGNEGPEQRATVRIENWKPFIAIVFALLIGVVGAFAALRARDVPSGRKPPWKVILVLAIALAAVEGITGVASLLTGALSIPPYLGAGTLVDVSLLIVGLATPLAWSSVARKPPRPS